MQDIESSIKVASDITPQNVRETIPVYKTIGLERTSLLAEVNPEIWTEIIPDLIDWTCDPNWPSTRTILPLLVSNPVTIEAAIPHVEAILLQDGPCSPVGVRDDEHQNVLLYHFCGKIGMPLLVKMRATLMQFRENITPELELDWEWTETVDALLEQISTG